MNNPLVRLAELGQSPWYDFITRELIESGELERLIREDGLRGMTTNPTIFEKAITGTGQYDSEIRRLADAGRSAREILEEITVQDVRRACDVFRSIYDATERQDGLVSIEVAPSLAHETEGTIVEAERLWSAVDRPNVMIKIPGTQEGLGAIEECLARGINVNVTLLFSVDRYEQVIDAFMSGLERLSAVNGPLDTVASVASFFVSRVDTNVDARLDALEDDGDLRGRVAIANAAIAYERFERAFEQPRWRALAQSRDARPQRPLWASTSTKDPNYPDTYYVDALVAPRTVNTLPPATFEAYRDHGDPTVRIRDYQAAAPRQLERLAELGIDIDAVTDELEDEGVVKFADSYDSLLAGIRSKAEALVARA